VDLINGAVVLITGDFVLTDGAVDWINGVVDLISGAVVLINGDVVLTDGAVV
jgi:hypothetical protein